MQKMQPRKSTLFSTKMPIMQQIVNLNHLTTSLQKNRIMLKKQKNELQDGLNILNFLCDNDKVEIMVYVLLLRAGCYVVAGYIRGDLIEERECQNEDSILQIVLSFFKFAEDNGYVKHQQTPIYNHGQKLLSAAQKLASKGNSGTFMQQIKTMPENKTLKQEELAVLARNIEQRNWQKAQHRKLNEKGYKLMKELTKIENQKMQMESAYLQFTEKKMQLINIEEMCDKLIENVKLQQLQTPQNDEQLDHFIGVETKLQKLMLIKKHIKKSSYVNR